MDLNQQQSIQPSVQPLPWTWIVQRHPTDGQAASIWKFGFIAPDGADVRVTFHQVGGSPQESAAQSIDPMTGMPAQPGPTDFAPPGQPNVNRDQTDSSTFYVTFFSNRYPQNFLKWDTSLMHEDSLTTWVTITHGIIDFMGKANPLNVILDDLANGKLKMVLRSVAMDVVASNQNYQIEQTQQHHYRSYFQIKRVGTNSAFQTATAQGQMGDVNPQAMPQGAQSPANVPSSDPVQPALAPSPQQADQVVPAAPGDKNGDPTVPADGRDATAFPSHEQVPIKQTPPTHKGYTVEIGQTDYSVAVKDEDGNAIDRYRAKSPGDILRWINQKGLAGSRMVIVVAETPSQLAKPKMAISPMASPDVQSPGQVTEDFVIEGNIVRMPVIPAKQAALMNNIVNAGKVKCTAESVEFVFENQHDMAFKKALVELAFNRTNSEL